MNNEKEFFVNDVKTNVSEEEIVLAPPTELFEEAKEIAQNTKSDEKFPFTLQYDSNQAEFLLSMLETVGAIVEENNEEKHTISTMMNMTQLAFIKRLDCVERVKTDEGKNPFLAEEVMKLASVQHEQQESESVSDEVQQEITNLDGETLEVQSKLATAGQVDAPLEATAIAENIQENDGVAVASVTASARSSCSSCSCPTNNSMETAKTISDESYTTGHICCPGAEQWFKFTATRTGQYTICTTDSLDTIGTLYDHNGEQIEEVDDYEPCGKINFRIIRTLIEGRTYYIKVRLNGNGTGYYTLRVTNSVLANSTHINHEDFAPDEEVKLVLTEGVTYELPFTPNYTYKGYNGAQRIPGLSVSIDPANTTEQKVLWYEQHVGVLDVTHGWDDDGDRYPHVTATGTGIAKLYAVDWIEHGKRDECTVYVGGAPVTGITLNVTQKTMSIGEEDYLHENVEPENALNKNVTWESDNTMVVDVNEEGYVTAVNAGTAKITVKTLEGNYSAICTITVDPRPKVLIEEDNEGVYDFFKVTFPTSEGGLVWKSIGEDLSKLNITLNPYHHARYNSNNAQEFSCNQLAFLYRLDPLGVAHYAKNHWVSCDDYLTKKDNLYLEIFGRKELELGRFYFHMENGQPIYEEHIGWSRNNIFSNAEILFGFHNNFNWSNFARDILEYIFTSLPGVEQINTGVELHEALYYSRSFANIEYASSYVANYIDGEMQSEIHKRVERTVTNFQFKLFVWVIRLLITAAQSAFESFMPPNQNDTIIYSKVNEQTHYLPMFLINEKSVSMGEFLEQAT